jgi:hypothetical protein
VTARTYPGLALVAETPVHGVAFTPGATNSTQATLPPFPPLWLSEVQPENLSGITDNVGELEPWIELQNAGAEPLSLAEVCLSDNFVELAQWAFPTGTVIAAGQYLVVWADGEPGETVENHLHTSFRLTPPAGTVVLSRLLGNAPQILDYFNYGDVAANQSYGAFPAGQGTCRQVFHRSTPGATNDPTAPPVSLFINEWMAVNQAFLADPTDGQFDDWFELWNPSTNAVDLGGFWLTDTASNPNKFIVPADIFVPARGFLLVWADEDSTQTRTNGDLHVNFRLAQGGESIELRDRQGRLVDRVAFGPQTGDMSQGHFPDGTGPLFFMPTPSPRAPNLHAACSGEIDLLRIETDGTTIVPLHWFASPGCVYRVQFKDDLGAAGWTDLPGDVRATGTSVTKTDYTLGFNEQRFYRVMLVE